VASRPVTGFVGQSGSVESFFQAIVIAVGVAYRVDVLLSFQFDDRWVLLPVPWGRRQLDSGEDGRDDEEAHF